MIDPEENHSDEPIEISTGIEHVEPKPEDLEQGQYDGMVAPGNGEGEEMSGSEGDGQQEGEEQGEGSEENGDEQGDGDQEGDGESEEEKEEAEKKKKEKQEQRDQEDKETKDKRDQEDSEKSPDKKTKDKRDKEDKKRKEERDQEDQKEKQERRDKQDKKRKEERDQEDQDEKEKRDKEDQKDKNDPKKQKERKEKRAEQDFEKKKKREKQDKKRQEQRDKEDFGDSIIGKRVMLVYGPVQHLGEIFIVEKLMNTVIINDENDFSGREMKNGDRVQIYELSLASGDTRMFQYSRIDFILIESDSGESILWREGGKTYTNKVEGVIIPEKTIAIETPSGSYFVPVDKIIRSIPSTKTAQERKEEREKEKREKDDGLFHSLAVVLINDVMDIFKAKGLLPEEKDNFLVCHFPRKIYSIYKKVSVHDGKNNEELMKDTGSSLEDFRELDKYLAKMILKQFQIAAYYYDPEYAFDNILYDNLVVLNVFTAKNVLVKRPDSEDSVSIFRNDKTLTINSNIKGVTFLQGVIFGEQKNLIKFELWKEHKYERIQDLYKFLEFIVSCARLSDEDKSILEYDEINNQIANIYNTQLKALQNAI